MLSARVRLLALIAALVAPVAATANTARAAAPACGVERWAVKTLQDPAAPKVNLTPRNTTVALLRQLPAPHILPSTRLRGVERRTFTLKVRLVGFKLEEDSDVHLVIADPATGGTMIVEFPADFCALKASASYRGKMKRARAALLKACGTPPADHFKSLHGTATITGVGFFDFLHGQEGVAPNGIELHPVLRFAGKGC
jgi:hypothetical protein